MIALFSYFKALCIVNFLAKNLFKINGKYVQKNPLVLEVSFCSSPWTMMYKFLKKNGWIVFALASQLNDDVGTAEFHEKNFFVKMIVFCFAFFSMFLEGQYSISRINLGIVYYNHDRDILTCPQLPFYKNTKKNSTRCWKTRVLISYFFSQDHPCKKLTFYTEIFTRQLELCIFSSLHYTCEKKAANQNFQSKCQCIK